jgi:hypothetical protein
MIGVMISPLSCLIISFYKKLPVKNQATTKDIIQKCSFGWA